MKVLSIFTFLLTSSAVSFGQQNMQRQRSNPNLKDILTYNNFHSQKTKAGVKIYALPPDNTPSDAGATQSAGNTSADAPTVQTFVANPLVNYYKEFK
jgi:hypothetical protein